MRCTNLTDAHGLAARLGSRASQHYRWTSIHLGRYPHVEVDLPPAPPARPGRHRGRRPHPRHPRRRCRPRGCRARRGPRRPALRAPRSPPPSTAATSSCSSRPPTNADEKAVVQQARDEGASDVDRYATVLDGFSGELSDSAVEQVRSHPDVAYVEADQEVTASATQSPATWGLDRIDQRNLPLTNSYTYDRTGSGRHRLHHRHRHPRHPQRVRRPGRRPASTAINDGRGSNDCNGHGTHVAGTVGGATYGVAKAGHPRRRSACSTATARARPPASSPASTG